MKSLIWVVLVIGLAQPSFGRVNAEQFRGDGADLGIRQMVAARLGLAAGNSEFSTLKTDYRLDWRSSTTHFFVTGRRTFGKKQGDRFINNGFGHARLTQTLTPKFSVETFVQLSFDDFIALTDRKLLGGGIRWRVAGQDRDSQSVFFGLGVMGESENQNQIRSNRLRSTNYLTIHWQFNRVLKAYGTAYYQPAFSDWGDFRIFSSGGLTASITQSLDLLIDLDFRYDSESPSEFKAWDLELTNGLQFRF